MLSEENSRINFRAFLWHALFLALASNFMDVDTVIPSMLIKTGGTPIHIGILTAILVGGSSLFQLFFASFLSNKSLKKKYLLAGINLRIISLFCLALLFFESGRLGNQWVILMIFMLISVFSFSGSFAGVSYTDILGKSIKNRKRKRFFSLRQIVNSIFVFVSALVVRKFLACFTYPKNYGILFLGAGLLLFIASLGFWRIREIKNRITSRKSFIGFFSCIPSEIKRNKNLKYYLLVINSLGLGIGFLPFIILYAKVNFNLSYSLIGNFLLFRTVGMLTAGIFLFKYSHMFRYKNVLKFSLIVGSILPLISLLLNSNQTAYQFIYIISGIFAASYKVSINGVLLEISNNENRAAYAGISGAGSILQTLFPLTAGFFISIIGYSAVFIAVSVIILISYNFIKKLECQPSIGAKS